MFRLRRARISHAVAAHMIGMAEHEVVTVKRRRAGLCITPYDGQTLIVVPADRPDGAGRSGILFLHAVPVGYRFGMPSYTKRPWFGRTLSPKASPAAATPGNDADRGRRPDLTGAHGPASTLAVTA